MALDRNYPVHCSYDMGGKKMGGNMKDLSWRYKTCKECAFQVKEECRRFPPSNENPPKYPHVWLGTVLRKYKSACAEYQAKL